MDNEVQDRDYRKGAKTRLRLSAKRKRPSNIKKWNNRSLTNTDQREENTASTSRAEEKDVGSSIQGVQRQYLEKKCKRRLQFESTDAEPEPSQLNVSQTSSNGQVEGRRIVDFQYIFDTLKNINSHGLHMGCSFNNLNIVSEKKEGLKSVFSIYCNMCNSVFKLHSDNPSNSEFDINHCAVAGIMNNGSGYSHLKSFTSCLNIPPMNEKYYMKVHDRVSDGWEKAAMDTMKSAAETEKEIAIANGCVDKDGVPLIRVVCDGSWARRSYNKTKMSALSGIGAIVGYNTRRVLYVGVKNKYCTVCARAENLNKEPLDHICYKNWDSSSCGMEAAAIAEGFLKSEEMYGIRYHEMIADGDSSCYKKILESRPYKNLTVQKIECRNHLLRNLCRKLREVSSSTKSGPLPLRTVIREKILKCRTAVVKATEFRKNESGEVSIKADRLRKDIVNIPSHIFGEHKNCAEYFCKKTLPDETNLIPEFKKHGMYNTITETFRYLSFHSRSLICDVDSNYVEQFNSIICKFIGGKRINYTQRRSYQARCAAAVVSTNTNRPFYNLYKHMVGKSPGKYAKKVEQEKLSILRKRKYAKKRKSESSFGRPNKDYGEQCQKPDLSNEEFEMIKIEFMNHLHRTKEEREDIEEKTRSQSGSDEWFEERRKLLTASNFGAVCRRRPQTSCSGLVKRMLYGYKFKSKATFWGQMKEEEAKEAFKKTDKTMVIKDCGLIIDPVIPFLGATPDGLIGLDGVVEIKCPYSARTLSPEDGIKKKKIKFWTVTTENAEYKINKKHPWYFQIQGQLHITRRIYCWLVVWTPIGIKCERITRDDIFWQDNMQEKLVTFYKTCILPELIDPRVRRNLPIREPAHILQAQQEHKQTGKKKRTTKK